MNDLRQFDVAIVGAGIAGAGLAASLAGQCSAVLLEQEERPAYHSSGRSAAIFIQNYGNAPIRALSRASAPLFQDADPEFFPEALLTPRGILTIADTEALSDFAKHLADGEGLDEVSAAEAVRRVPILKAGAIAGAAYEADAQDIDVHALHQGFLKRHRRSGGQVLCRAELLSAERTTGRWRIRTAAGEIEAGVLVNAAGGWADIVAARSGAAPVGLVAMRRSMAVLPAPDGVDCSRWPLVADAAERWYMKPESGRMLVSPADEDLVEPHDVFADDMVLAEGLYRFEQAVTIPIDRVETSWAGLRTFAPDRTPVCGYDPSAEGFFWLAGQGGYGMQTAPALSRLAADLLLHRQPDLPGLDETLVSALSPARFAGR
ncbi:FAD-binding oxidoreductase [Stappia sp. F7233]|uniref:FAD-binding oxidoreductase n=1 Tax=Stappia albiluteola TaxID=2758565 RepID=A0A839AE07_9HYPH|nr:FAD-binding oxidoreductase [Stappia albiluteola]MBA5777194.1 FAD-binding oxidoreductase [Stappia albiluteola]